MVHKKAAEAALDFSKAAHLRVLFCHAGETAVSNPLSVRFQIICARKSGEECKLGLLDNIESLADKFVHLVKEVVPENFHGQDLHVKGTSATSSIDDLLDTLQNAVLSHHREGPTSMYGWQASADHPDALCLTILSEKEVAKEVTSTSQSRGPKSLTAPSSEVCTSDDSLTSGLKL